MPIGIIVNGQAYTFDNPTYGYVTATDGFGMPPLDRFSSRGAQQHGDDDLGYRLDARRVALVIMLPSQTEAEFYQARKRLLQLFHPDRKISLFVTDGGDLDRRLEVVFDASLGLPLEHEWRAQKLTVTLKTSGLPAWYDPVAQSQAFDIGGGSEPLTLPMSVPHGVGSTEINASAVVEYLGTWQEYPRIRITGPVTDCIIENYSTGETLDFTGFELSSGHSIEIDTSYGSKTVLYDGVTNYLEKLTAESDLATFHLAPAEAGENAHENTFHVSGSGANTETKVEVFYNNRYLGI